jgi:hypothetical protein
MIGGKNLSRFCLEPFWNLSPKVQKVMEKCSILEHRYSLASITFCQKQKGYQKVLFIFFNTFNQLQTYITFYTFLYKKNRIVKIGVNRGKTAEKKAIENKFLKGPKGYQGCFWPKNLKFSPLSMAHCIVRVLERKTPKQNHPWLQSGYKSLPFGTSRNLKHLNSQTIQTQWHRIKSPLPYWNVISMEE